MRFLGYRESAFESVFLTVTLMFSFMQGFSQYIV